MNHLNLRTNQIAILLVNILVLCLWGFAGIGKIVRGFEVPSWFIDTFKDSMLASFPGHGISYYSIVFAEITAFVLAVVSLFRLEFIKPQLPFLRLTLLLSIANFLMLEFGVLLIGDSAGQPRLFNYFVLCLIMYAFLDRHENVIRIANPKGLKTEHP